MPICAECRTDIELPTVTPGGRRLCLPCWHALKRAWELAAREARAADPEWRAYWRRLREELEAETAENR